MVVPPPEIEYGYELHPKQAQAMQLLGLDDDEPNPDPVEEMLYGGQAGPGKSHLLRCVALSLALRWPGCRVGLFRRKRTELFDTHLDKCHQEWPSRLVSYRGEPEHEFRFANGSVVQLRFCDHEEDVYRYQSVEFDGGILVDEATQFSARMYTLLRSRVRATINHWPGWHRVILAAANPNGIGHTYFKQNFVTAGQDGVPFFATDVPQGMQSWKRVFLRARLSDNPSIDYDSYMSQLQSIADPEMRRAMAEGDWDLFVGQLFSTFRQTIHVATPIEVPDEWPKFYSLDYGYSDPLCVLWHAKVPPGISLPVERPDMRVSERSRILTYRELWKSELVPQLQAMRIKQMSGGRKLGPCWASPDMWSRESSGVSISSEYQAAGFPLLRANNDRLAGVARIHRALHWEDGQPPEWVISEECRNLLRTLPNIPRDDHNPEDASHSYKDDHAFEASRYGLMGGTTRRKNGVDQRQTYAIGSASR